MHRFRNLAITAALLAVPVLFYFICGRWPTGAAQGGPLPAPPATRPSEPPVRLRLLTFNIHSGVGTDNHLDLGRTSKVIDGADLVALQEVSGDRPWRQNQVTELAKLLSMTPLFSPTEYHYAYPVFGNGVLTKVRVEQWQRIPLPNGYHMAHRDALKLMLPFGRGTLNVLAVHMGKKSDRARQFAVVRELFKSLPAPAVLMGDLNTRPYDAMMEDLLRSEGVHDVVGEHIAPVDRVDFILTRGVRCLDAGLIVNDASDHPAAWAEIESDP